MEIVDILILLVILSFGLTGASNGFFKQTVLTVGTILVFVLSYKLKDYIANFLSYRFPFFNFSGPFEGLSTVNIILYQMSIIPSQAPRFYVWSRSPLEFPLQCSRPLLL